jgi:hypothetical protein
MMKVYGRYEMMKDSKPLFTYLGRGGDLPPRSGRKEGK